MALIKCPECNKEVSDKAKSCIHCGYPLEEYAESNQFKKISLDEVCPLCKSQDWSVHEEGGFIRCDSCTYEHSLDDEKYCAYLEKQEEANTPKCLTCGSTNLRRLTFSDQLFQRYEKTFKCNNCQYEW